MGNKPNNLPDRLVKGGVKRSQEAKVPIASGGEGSVRTNINIRWTRNKAIVAAIVLGVPFLLATVMAFKSGNLVVGCILVVIAIFFAFIYFALRYIENNEF